MNIDGASRRAVVMGAIEDLDRAVSHLTDITQQIESFLCLLNDPTKEEKLQDVCAKPMQQSLPYQRANRLNMIKETIEKNTELLQRCFNEMKDL